MDAQKAMTNRKTYIMKIRDVDFFKKLKDAIGNGGEWKRGSRVPLQGGQLDFFYPGLTPFL